MFLGVDIGVGSIKIASLKKGAAGLVLERTAVIELDAEVAKKDLREKVLAVKQALRTFLQQEGAGKARIAVSISGQNIFTRSITLPPAPAEKLDKIIKYEAQQQVPFAEEDIIWDYHSFKRQGQLEVLFVAVKKTVPAELLNLESVNPVVSVDVIDVAPIALYNAVRYFLRDEQLSSYVVLDIGAEVMNILICTPERVWTRTVFMGGADITNSIAKKLTLTSEQADEIKRKEADCVLTAARRQGRAALAYDALVPVLNDIVGEVNHSLAYYRSTIDTAVHFEKVFITGGSSRLAHIDEFLAQHLSLPVERLDLIDRALGGASLPISEDDKARLVCALGLALRGYHEQIPVSLNLLPADAVAARSFRKRRWKMHAAFTAGIAVSLGIGLVLRSQNATRLTALQAAGISAEQREQILRPSELHALQNDIARLTQDLTKYKKLVRGKNWSSYLCTLSELLPDDMWIAAIDQKNDEVVMRGFTTGRLTGIDEFLSRLKQSPFVASVKVVTAGVSDDEQDQTARGLKAFEVQMKVREE